MADLEAEGRAIEPDELRWIHRHKTGALFAAGCEIGAIHAAAPAAHQAALARFGRAVGLAFQITDDLLDRTGDRQSLGKTPGKDDHSGKATYPGLLGVEASRDEATQLVGRASEALSAEALLTEPLAALGRHAVKRTH